jgi:hypothetical protein
MASFTISLGMRFFIFFLLSTFSLWAKETTFCSQASQDKFVHMLLYKILNKQDTGYYLEIGASHPIKINNTFFFEKRFEWIGISIDIKDQKSWYTHRKNPLLVNDALKVDYDLLLKDFPPLIDYLSLDIDGWYDTVLKKIPLNDYIFKIITIEHDAYWYGDKYRNAERSILTSHGYYLLCANVRSDQNLSFEDWWIHPSAFPPDVFAKLASLDLKETKNKRIIEIIQKSFDTH